MVTKFQNKSCAKQQISIYYLSKKRATAQIPIEHSHFGGWCTDSNKNEQPLHMAMCNSLETISGLILTQSQPKFVAKW